MENSYDTKVWLLAVTSFLGDVPDEAKGIYTNQETLLEYAGRICYNSLDKMYSNEKWLESRIKEGHESLVEHASATFMIECSRVVTHELVRHRIASYSQRSQRYVTESVPSFILPPGMEDTQMYVEKGFNNATIFTRVMDLCWSAYKTLIENGFKPEIARYVLPNATKTTIVVTMNFRELRHFIKLRISPAALPEMREVAGKIRMICQKIAPKVFGDL